MARAHRDRGSRRYADLLPLIDFVEPPISAEQQQQHQQYDQQHQNVPKSMETLCRELDKMRTQDEAGSMCDFKLVCKNKDKVFPCHKVILTARSDYFKALFSNQDFTENEKNEMTLTEEEEKHIDAFLGYIYGGKPRFKSCSRVASLLRMADKYLIDDLKKDCEEWLINHASTAFRANSREYLRLIAQIGGLERLKKTLGNIIFCYRSALTQEMLVDIHAVGPEFLGDILNQV